MMVHNGNPPDEAASSSMPGPRPSPDFQSDTHFSETMDATCPKPLCALPNDVLIVEDDPIIALDFEDTILGLGVQRIRTAGNVAKALEMIADRAPDFALLDVGLINEKSFAVAERLEVLRIRFAFVTGYGAEVRLPAAFAQKPRLPKPCPTDALESVLKLRSGEGAEQ